MSGSGRDLRRHVLPQAPPAGLRRLWLGAVPVGWVPPAVGALLAGEGVAEGASGGALRLADVGALGRAEALLAARGLFRPVGEPFAVRADGGGDDATGPEEGGGLGGASPGAAVLGAIDRAALPVLGLWAHNAHLNGLVRGAHLDGPVRDAEGVRVWVATRAAHKVLGPGKLDQMVAGGVPLGLDARATLLKEAGEEAGLPAALAGGAVAVGSLRYALERPEGLRREAMHCFDLWLPEGFEPVPVDGEVAGFALWPAERVRDVLRDTEDFLFDAAMAVRGLLVRLGVIGVEG